MRRHVATTRTPWPGWDKQVPERLSAGLRLTQGAGGIVVQRGPQRPLARPLSGGHHESLPALDVPATCGTRPAGEESRALAAPRLARRSKRLLLCLATAQQRPRRLRMSRPQALGRAFPGAMGTRR